MISSSTRLLGLFGWPVARSLSPMMQNAALKAWSKNAVYGAFAVAPQNLQTAVSGAHAMGFLGLNITLPFKEAILALCKPDLLATRVGAVNTITFRSQQVLGTNTDVEGFKRWCAEAGVLLNATTQVVILGSGGAARAVVTALHDCGAPYQVFSRQAAEIAVDGQKILCLPLTKGKLTPFLSACQLLVDCTPRGFLSIEPGMSAELAFLMHYPELDLSLLNAQATVLDLVTQPSTLLTHMAKVYGLKAICGHGMLIYQGAKALEYWFSEPLPRVVFDAMREAISLPSL